MEKHLSDDAKENSDTVVHVFKRQGAGEFAQQHTVSVTAQGWLTICLDGHCITKHPEDWHAMAAKETNMIDEQEADDEALVNGTMTEVEYLRRKVMRLEAALRAARS